VPRFPPHPERRTAVVTGASSGIGAATARVLAGAGHPVVLAARRLDVCQAIAEEIREAGSEATALRLDLADPSSIEEFACGALSAAGTVEILVSNAARSTPGRALDTEPADFAETLSVNLLGAQHLARLLVAPMLKRRRGDLVFVTSETVSAPRPGAAGYVSSKWGLEGLARALQMELEGTGVRATIVRPGQTVTEMGSDWDPALAAEVIESWIHWGLARHNGFLHPDGVAAAVLAAVSMPRGTHISAVDVQPEAPIGAAPDPSEQPDSLKARQGDRT
jgi:NADP-dependent 3-hydroxy acid dehydrogenase YdfG